MAFKIDTQAYQIRYTKPTLNIPASKLNEETPKNAIQTSSSTTKPQVKFPSHNLLDKYNSAGFYYGSQSALNEQFGIKKEHANSSDDEGKKALMENLQQQSQVFNDGISSEDSNLSLGDALGEYLRLEDIALQKRLQEQRSQQAQNDFLNALVWNLKKNLPL